MIKNYLRLWLLLLSFSAAAADLKTSAEEALMSGDMALALESYIALLAENPDDAEVLEMAVMLSIEADAADLGMELLVAEVDRAVVAGDKSRIQAALGQLTEISAASPAWVDDALEAAAEIGEDQAGDYQVWDCLLYTSDAADE